MQVRKKSLSLRLKQTLFMKKIIIAIDGFSSCGKSTMAKDLAREIGYIYIDSGAMYRAVTLYCMEHGLFNADGSIREKDLQDQMDDIHISFRRQPATADVSERCLRGRPHPQSGSFVSRKPGCRPGICPPGTGQTAAGHG